MVVVTVYPPPAEGQVVVEQPVGEGGVGGRLVGGIVAGGELGEVEPIIDVVVGAVDAGGTVPSDGLAWQV